MTRNYLPIQTLITLSELFLVWRNVLTRPLIITRGSQTTRQRHSLPPPPTVSLHLLLTAGLMSCCSVLPPLPSRMRSFEHESLTTESAGVCRVYRVCRGRRGHSLDSPDTQTEKQTHTDTQRRGILHGSRPHCGSWHWAPYLVKSCRVTSLPLQCSRHCPLRSRQKSLSWRLVWLVGF